MAANGTITLGFKVENIQGGMKQLVMDADALRKVMTENVKVTQKLVDKTLHFSAAANVISQAQSCLSSLNNTIKGLTDAYQVQKVAETQLETVMRQRMNATEGDIDAIKRLAAEQQKLGVIGDEVQLSGAQQIATFVTQRQTLETLIPAMNNLIAQQNGLNATNSDAVSVANLMGKAMQGQVSALKRVGITFNEAQEQVMKFGTESQRAAMLADIITQNVGEMNAALAATDAGKAKQMENKLGDIKEQLGGLMQSFAPYVSMAANIAIATSGVIKFTTCLLGTISAIKAMNLAQTGLAIKTKATNLVFSITSKIAPKYAVGMEMMSISTNGAARATIALKVALRGLLIASGVGLALWALSEAVSFLSSSSEKASDSVDSLIDAEARAKRDAERQKNMQDEVNATMVQSRAELEKNIMTLKKFNGSRKKEIELVDQMNNTYGETMGYFSSVSDWYKALTENSEAYCKQMIVEARTRALANQIAGLEQENHNILYNDDGSRRRFSTNTIKNTKITSKDTWNPLLWGGTLPQYRKSDWEEATDTYQGNRRKIESLQKQLQEGINETNNINFKVKGSSTKPTLTTAKPKATKSGQTELQRISAEIEKLKQKYTTAEGDKEGIQNQIADLEKRKTELQNLLEAAGRPLTLDSENAFNKELQYLKSMRGQADKEELAQYDAKIKEVEDKRRRFLDSAHSPLPLEAIETYEQLSAEADYYTDKLKYATAEERAAIQEQINRLNELRTAWDNVLAELDAPADIALLNSIEQLDKAIGYIDAKMQRATASELAGLLRTKSAYERKRKTLTDIVDITADIEEANRINLLPRKSHKSAVKAMGFDELTDKIQDLRDRLADPVSPVSDTQRRDIESLIKLYEHWRAECVDTWGTMRRGYGEIKNIGSAINGITEAIDGNGNAWDRLTGIVDGFLQLFDGIKAIVDVINMMAAASHAHAAAKQTETAATVASTAATMADTSATAANLTVKEADAIAGATKSGASMPFPMNLVAIAAGVAAVLGAFALIGSFSTGGIVGGSSPQGDKLLARVNSGEMILNKAQQTRLYNALNTTGQLRTPAIRMPYSSPREMSVAPEMMRLMTEAARQPVIIGGTLRLKGRDVVGVLANETRIASRSGRRTNIKL